jgi:hypothetical protein
MTTTNVGTAQSVPDRPSSTVVRTRRAPSGGRSVAGPGRPAGPGGSGGPGGPGGSGGIGPRSADRRRQVWAWPVLAAPAWVAIWSGWVGLGELTGAGPVHPLPGIWDSLSVNTAITLPVGAETYAAYALRVWLSGDAVPAAARRFAKWSAIGSLLLGAAGQVAYRLMGAAGVTAAPWPVTMLVACLPVAVLGMGAALAHLLNSPR